MLLTEFYKAIPKKCEKYLRSRGYDLEQIRLAYQQQVISLDDLPESPAKNPNAYEEAIIMGRKDTEYGGATALGSVLEDEGIAMRVAAGDGASRNDLFYIYAYLIATFHPGHMIMPIYVEGFNRSKKPPFRTLDALATSISYFLPHVPGHLTDELTRIMVEKLYFGTATALLRTDTVNLVDYSTEVSNKWKRVLEFCRSTENNPIEPASLPPYWRSLAYWGASGLMRTAMAIILPEILY